jgi:hypothetical protein
MRYALAALYVTPLLALCACSSHVSRAAFCTDVDDQLSTWLHLNCKGH